MGKLQNEDFKTEAEIVSAGGTKAQLLNDTKIYVTGLGINKTLDDAIIDGNIGGSAIWGNITGTLSAQTDLQTALNARQPIHVSNTFTGTSITPAAGRMTESLTYTGGSPQTFSTTGFGTISALSNGRRFTLFGSSDTNTLTINESDITDGRIMNGSIVLGRGKYITFEYNSTIARMVEIARSLDA